MISIIDELVKDICPSQGVCVGIKGNKAKKTLKGDYEGLKRSYEKVNKVKVRIKVNDKRASVNQIIPNHYGELNDLEAYKAQLEKEAEQEREQEAARIQREIDKYGKAYAKIDGKWMNCSTCGKRIRDNKGNPKLFPASWGNVIMNCTNCGRKAQKKKEIEKEKQDGSS